MDSKKCSHADVREFDGLRSCLACGETRFREETSQNQAGVEAQAYIYTDLRCLERGQTIRLVVLAPGDYEDPIRCTLVLSGIQHSDYDAVSYTWATEDGDDSKSHAVYIDGSILRVTRNCHAALRQLRHGELHQRLWIDAICINQDNVRERNHQVDVMDRIYRSAQNVHICIQDDTHSYSEAMSWLSRSECSDLDGRLGLRQLEQLFRLRYFGRVWTIQEVVLARVITLHVNADRLILTRDSLYSLSAGIEMPDAFLAWLHPTTHMHLHEQLTASMKCSCSDPRDHIYAILSLLDPEVRSLIPVDYSLSVQTVFANAIKAYIATYQNLNIVTYAATYPKEGFSSVTQSLSIDDWHKFLRGKTTPSLPSDHRYPSQWTRTVQFVANHDAQISSPQIAALPPDTSGQQILPGFLVRIYSSQACEWSSELPFEAISGNQSRSTTRNRGPRHSPQELLPLVSVDWRRLLRAIRQLAGPNSYGSKMFGTKHGIGRSVLAAAPGDLVCYVDGMEVELLVRRISEIRYKIVSVCRWQPFQRGDWFGPYERDDYASPAPIEMVELY